MGKASRNRRQKKDQERQRPRAARATGLGWSPGGQRVPSQQELVVAAVRRRSMPSAGVTSAVCGGPQAAGGGAVARLDAAVSREIAGFLRVSVTASWRHGWQPAELVRHVGRELGDAHADLAADMVVDEMRGYALAMVDDRWAVKASAFGPRCGGERLRPAPGAGIARVAIELLHLLQHVPVLNGCARCRARPAPGRGRRAATRTSGSSVRSRAAGEGGVHGVPGRGGGAVGPRAGADGQAQHRSRAARRPVREQGQAGRAAAAG